MRKRAISPGSEQCPTYTHIYKIYRFVSNYWTHMKQTCILSCIFTRIRLWVVLNSNILVMLVCIKNMLTYSTTIYYHEPILNFIYDMISNWTLVHIILSWHDMESVYQNVYIYNTMDIFESAVWRVDMRETIVNIYYDIITLYDVAFETYDFDQVRLIHC